MVTTDEILKAGLVPFLVALVCVAVGWWRGWGWMGPVAVGAGFLVGVGLLGVPKLPPRDGVDWVFWMAVPAAVLGVVDAIWRPRAGWMMGAMAGVVALVVVGPLVPRAVSAGEAALMAASMGAVAVFVCLAIGVAEPRVGTVAVVVALAAALGGAAVVVMSSNLRIVGVYGLAAAAATAPAALLWKHRVGRSVAIVGMAIMAGLLAGGRSYADPGVSATEVGVLVFSPAAVLMAGAIRGPRWVRALVAVAAVLYLVALVAAPSALKAKKAAESVDPYEAMYR